MGRLATGREKKLEELREELWPGSKKRVWRASEEKGYCCVPRVLPLLMHLMSDKTVIEGKSAVDCGVVYLELLARDRGQGLVEIASEGEHAYLAGYTGARAARTWRERVRALAAAGFVSVKEKPNQPVGFVLLVHPHLAVSALKAKGKVSTEWWEVYQRLQREYGSSLPEPDEAKKPLKLVKPPNGSAARRSRRGAG